MNELWRDRIRERALDTRDWIDIRPDPHWWPCLAIPGVIGLAYWLVPHNFLPILLLAAAGLAVLLAGIWIAAGIVWLLWKVLSDVVAHINRERTPQVRHSTPAPKLSRSMN